MSFWVQHGLHLALVVVPSSAMGAGLAVERRKGIRERRAAVEATSPGAVRPAAASPGVGRPTAVRSTTVRSTTGRSTTDRSTAVRSAVVRPAVTSAARDRPDGDRRPLALPAVVIGAAGAALTHLVVMPEHFRVSYLYGTFFLLAAILQMSWAAVVAYRPTRGVLVAGAVGCAATILLWLVSRTAGIPTAVGGIGGGAPEAVGTLDVLATAFEALAVIGVVVALRGASLAGGSPARWPVAARAVGVTALCGTAALAFWAPVS